MSETVTLQIGGLENEDILITSNIKIAFICNNPSELYSYIDDVKNTFEEGDSVVAYVKTVYEPIDGTITQYQNAKGMYYLFNWENDGWDPIALGTHTHNNLELLDQLGELDPSDLRLNQRKILAVKKVNTVNPDYDNGDYDGVYTYRFEYVDLGEIPNLPERPNTDKPLYLSVDENGEYKWINQLVPAQTFCYLTITIDDDNVNQYIYDSGKTLRISYGVLAENKFVFNPDLDKLLVFDSGRLLSDIGVNKNDNDMYLEITISSEDTNAVLEIGDQITIIVIRDGAAAILEELDGRYCTKQEAFDAITDHTLSLDGYPTTEAMKEYAAPRVHKHNQYVAKQELDNGFLDWKYAPFYHIHSEYLTEAEASRYQKESLKLKSFKIGDIVDNNSKQLQIKINTLSRIEVRINRAFNPGDIFKILIGTNSTNDGIVLIGNAGNPENEIDITATESYVYEFNKKYDSSDEVFYIYPYFNGMVDQSGHYSGDGDITVYYN